MVNNSTNQPTRTAHKPFDVFICQFINMITGTFNSQLQIELLVYLLSLCAVYSGKISPYVVISFIAFTNVSFLISIYFVNVGLINNVIKRYNRTPSV